MRRGIGSCRQSENSVRFVGSRPLDAQERDFAAGLGILRSKLAENCKGLKFRIGDDSPGILASRP